MADICVPCFFGSVGMVGSASLHPPYRYQLEMVGSASLHPPYRYQELRQTSEVSKTSEVC